MLETFREHVVIKFVEGYVFADFITCMFFGSGMNNLYDRTFCTLNLTGYISKLEERVENRLDQFKLIWLERIEIDEIIDIGIRIKVTGKLELNRK